GGTGDLLDDERAADAAPAGRPGRVLDGDVVGDEHAADGEALGLPELGGDLEVEHVAGVVLDDLDDPGAAVGRLHGGEDRLGAGRGEHGARDGGVEHADADEAGVERLMAAAPAGDEPDLPGDGAAGPGDEDRVLAGGEDVGVRGHEAGDGLGDDVTWVVDELLHCGLPRRRGTARPGRAATAPPPPAARASRGEDGPAWPHRTRLRPRGGRLRRTAVPSPAAVAGWPRPRRPPRPLSAPPGDGEQVLPAHGEPGPVVAPETPGEAGERGVEPGEGGGVPRVRPVERDGGAVVRGEEVAEVLRAGEPADGER